MSSIELYIDEFNFFLLSGTYLATGSRKYLVKTEIIDNLKIFNQYFFPIVRKLKKATTQKVTSVSKKR